MEMTHIIQISGVLALVALAFLTGNIIVGGISATLALCVTYDVGLV